MKKIIGVMCGTTSTPDELRLAYETGKVIARFEAVLLTGGMGGAMEACSKGAKEGNGLVLALCPTANKEDLNSFVDIGIVTGMAGGRNYMNVKSSDIVIAIGSHSVSTLSEIAFAIQASKPLIIVNASKNMESYLLEFNHEHMYFVSTVEDIKKRIASLVNK